MARAVEEVGVAERHVGGAGGDLLAHVGEHRLQRHHEEAATVDRRDRAVAAPVLAATAGLHGGRQLAPARALDVRVLLQARQRLAGWHRKVQLDQLGAGRIFVSGEAGGLTAQDSFGMQETPQNERYVRNVMWWLTQ